MKCEIIRDLLPLYLDELTSEESNEAIREHLEECEECKGILEQMQKETEIEADEGESEKKINIFRKLNRKMKLYIAATLAVCMVVGVFVNKVYEVGFPIDPRLVKMEVRVSEKVDMLILDFTMDHGRMKLCSGWQGEKGAGIGFRKVWRLPWEAWYGQASRYNCTLDLGMMGIDMDRDTEGENNAPVERTDWSDYVVEIDYGNEMVVYTLEELLEMAE